MSLDLTALDPALKQYYKNIGVQDLASQGRPCYALIKKDENAGGRNWPIPVRYTNPQGTSHDYQTAIANSSESELEDYLLGAKKLYTNIDIDALTLKATKSKKLAFEMAVKEIDHGIEAHMDSLSKKLFRASGGAIGEIQAITEVESPREDSITLKSTGDAFNFFRNQVLNGDTVNGGGTVHVGAATVTSVDVDAGKVHFSSSPTGSITGLAVDDFLFVDGDYGLSLSGFASWIPDTAPVSGDSFLSVDRSNDPVRLAGSRLAASGLSVEEALINMSNKLSKLNSKPDYCFMSFDKYRDLILELEGRLRYVDVDSGKVGFKGVEIIGRDGAIVCLPDNGCPDERAYMVQSDTWVLMSVEGAPHIKDEDGSKFFRSLTADDYSTQIISYCNLACLAPGKNGVIKFDE